MSGRGFAGKPPERTAVFLPAAQGLRIGDGRPHGGMDLPADVRYIRGGRRSDGYPPGPGRDVGPPGRRHGGAFLPGTGVFLRTDPDGHFDAAADGVAAKGAQKAAQKDPGGKRGCAVVPAGTAGKSDDPARVFDGKPHPAGSRPEDEAAQNSPDQAEPPVQPVQLWLWRDRRCGIPAQRRLLRLRHPAGEHHLRDFHRGAAAGGADPAPLPASPGWCRSTLP